jgi:hypothetical protein
MVTAVEGTEECTSGVDGGSGDSGGGGGGD